jgi:hypothetical protein
MYINLFWMGVLSTLVFEIGFLFLVVGISHIKEKDRKLESYYGNKDI